MICCNIAVVDIGGTNIKYGFLPAGTQTPQCTKETPTNAHLGGATLMETVQALLRTLPAFDRIGVSTCGQVDRQTGGIRYATDNVPGYTGTPVRTILEEAFGVRSQWRMTLMPPLWAKRTLVRGAAARIFYA